jgi:uncharacterized protein (TIGR01370 family)
MNNTTIDTQKQESVFVCYGKINPKNVDGYKYLILESSFYTNAEIQKFKENNEHVFAYLSLGEMNKYSKHYDSLKSTFIGENDNWNSFLLNLELEKTTAILTESIEEYIQLGFNGVFFDNLDNFGIHGKQTTQKNNLLDFIQQMKLQYPHILFIQNAGLEFIDFTSPFIEAVLVESVASNFDFNSSTYELRLEEEFKSRLNQLNTIHNLYNVTILFVEYANTQEKYNAIQKRLKPSEIPFFVGTIDLQTKPNFNPIPSYAF